MIVGNKEDFAIEFHLVEKDYGEFNLIINEKEILSFTFQEQTYPYKGNLTLLHEWFKENLQHILVLDLNPLPYIIPLKGNSVAEKANFFSNFDAVFETFDNNADAFEVMQQWIFKHEWSTARENGFLNSIFFYCPYEEWIEVSWDNQGLYQNFGVELHYPKGLAYINKKIFQEIVEQFLEIYEIENNKFE